MPPTSDYLTSLAPFNQLHCSISKVHKTGLGSSAALTTSLVASLLIHLGVVSRDLSDEDLALLHNAAQLAHCAAQGKVGSGFDVSSAVWGSQVFRRFDPMALEALLQEVPAIGVEGSEVSQQCDLVFLARGAHRRRYVSRSAVHQPTDIRSVPDLLSHLDPRHVLWQPSPLSAAEASSGATKIDGSHPTAYEGLYYAPANLDSNNASEETSVPSIPRPAPLELPPRIEMLLADVDAGSNTPSLVGKVMEWRKKKPEWAKQLYNVLATSNQSLADALLSLKITHDTDAAQYHEVLDKAAEIRSKVVSSKMGAPIDERLLICSLLPPS